MTRLAEESVGSAAARTVDVKFCMRSWSNRESVTADDAEYTTAATRMSLDDTILVSVTSSRHDETRSELNVESGEPATETTAITETNVPIFPTRSTFSFTSVLVTQRRTLTAVSHCTAENENAKLDVRRATAVDASAGWRSVTMLLSANVTWAVALFARDRKYRIREAVPP